MCRISPPKWRHGTNEVLHFIMDIPGDGTESNKDNRSGEEGDTQSDPASVNNSDSDYPGDSVEVNEPSTSRGRDGGCGRKMRCSSGCGGGTGWGQEVQGAVEEQACANYIFMLLILLCDSIPGEVL